MLTMKNEESVNYFARTLAIEKKMKACGEAVQENLITEKVIRSMTPKFNYVMCLIKKSNNLDTLTLVELQSSLLVHERRMKESIEEA